MRYELPIRGDLVLPDRVLPDGYVAVSDGEFATFGQREAASPRRAATGS